MFFNKYKKDKSFLRCQIGTLKRVPKMLDSLSDDKKKLDPLIPGILGSSFPTKLEKNVNFMYVPEVA